MFTADIANMTDEQRKELTKAVKIRATAEGEHNNSKLKINTIKDEICFVVSFFFRI